MAIITNMPQIQLDEHVSWHTKPGNPAAGGRTIHPWSPVGAGPAEGSGEEFLIWHEGYIQRFHAWVNSLPANEKPSANSLTPWTSIPAGLKMGMFGWSAQRAADEAKLQNMSNFETLDELGAFLEWGIHGYLHVSSSSMWMEPVLLSFESTKSTYFWQLHGLIDLWRQQWVDN